MIFPAKHALVVLSLGPVLAVALACKAAPPPLLPAPSPATPTVILADGFVVQVDLATTPEQQAKGLMFVESLAPERGMLFLFETDEKRPFWMKNCLISLDLVWLDENFRIVDISKSVPPCDQEPCPNYFPSREIRNVLELRGGLCAQRRVAVGDKLLVTGLPASARRQP